MVDRSPSGMADLAADLTAEMPAAPPISPGTPASRSEDPADDSPSLRRRTQLAAAAALRAAIPRGPARKVVAHGAAGTAEAVELVALQRAMFWLRIGGLGFILAMAPAIPGAAAVPLLAGTAFLGANLALQIAFFRQPSMDRIEVLAIVGLVADSAAAYLAGQAFIAGPEWASFAAYPLLALEAAVVLGRPGAFASTLASCFVFFLQETERTRLGFGDGTAFTAVVVGIYLTFGALSGANAGLARRQRADLRAVLEISSLLAQQESPTRIVQALDGRLRGLLGARVRSLAVRRPDGGYDILRWRTPETRVVTPEAVRLLSGHLRSDIEAEIRAGQALTIRIEPGVDQPIVGALGLPDWVRALTLVPIAGEGHLFGILPVLWDAPRVPAQAELDLLNGFAQQTGLAFEQSQLRKARELAATDSLTGLVNHRAFRDALNARLAEARRHGRVVSILFCDLDRFKAVNDRHGHAVGDLLLHRVAETIRATARAEDVVGRYGGDEIALLLPETGRFGALDLARRLIERVREVENGMGIDLTVGVAVFPEDATEPEALVARADAAMYAGKRLGGGRVVLASELPPEA